MRRTTGLTILFFVMAVGISGAEEVRWVPAAASNPGTAGTVWTTDLWIMSRVMDATIEVHVAFLPLAEGTAEPTEVTVEVPASRSIHIKDAVGALFNENRPGALRLRSEFLFEAQSRTFNSGGDGGTFGQGIPALLDENDLTGWALLGAANIPGDSGVRCNLGLLNTSGEAVDVSILVFDQATGDMIGGVERVILGGQGWTQVNVFNLVGADDRVADNAIVIGIGAPEIRAYLSRIDNRSGDGTFILPVDAKSVYSIPADWEVVPTLTYSSDIVIGTLVYTGEDGEDQIVTDPPSGWTTTLNFSPPVRFCYSATGTTEGGRVTMEVLTTREGGATASHRRTVGPGGSGPITIEDCFDLN